MGGQNYRLGSIRFFRALLLLIVAVPFGLFYVELGFNYLAVFFFLLAGCLIFFYHLIYKPVHENEILGFNLIFFSILLCVVAILTCIGGEGRFFPATPDWTIRDALLSDMINKHWPFGYVFGGQNYLLRAPLGMFMFPALIGKLSGVYSGFLALWGQNILALSVVLCVLCMSNSTQRSLTVFSVFCVFSGWDMVGACLVALLQHFVLHVQFALPSDIGWWNGHLQYSSTMTLLFWVPNHAVAGWLAAALLLLWDRKQIGLGLLITGVVLSSVWSPFALMGAFPFLLKALVESCLRDAASTLEIGLSACVVLLAAPALLYLISDSETVPKGFQTLNGVFIVVYVAFIGLEILPYFLANKWAVFAGAGGSGGFSKSTYQVAIISLLIIPFYKLGVSNDFVMRSSIPALAILSVTTGHNVYELFQVKKYRRLAVVFITLGVGSLTGIDQIWHIFAAPNLGISKCDLVQARLQDPLKNFSLASYLARETHVVASLKSRMIIMYQTNPSPVPCSDVRLKLPG